MMMSVLEGRSPLLGSSTELRHRCLGQGEERESVQLAAATGLTPTIFSLDGFSPLYKT